MQTCTANGWYVSCTTPPGRLSVARYIGPGFKRSRWGDADGRIFPDGEYTQFCLERGYLQPYINAERSVFKTTHKCTGRLFMRLARKAIKQAETYKDLLLIANELKARISEMGAPIFTDTAYFNGIMTCARRLRPDLVIMR